MQIFTAGLLKIFSIFHLSYSDITRISNESIIAYKTVKMDSFSCVYVTQQAILSPNKTLLSTIFVLLRTLNLYQRTLQLHDRTFLYNISF